MPPFLLPIYQSAAARYGVPWAVLAAINEIETNYGRNLNVSSAGAVGWMQFLPSSWARYGVDANRDGVRDPNNPVDAIYTAARYLRAAGAHSDLRTAIFAYNHAGWYVDSVLSRARAIGALPGGLVTSLTGLTHGRFPVVDASARLGGGSRRRSGIRVIARAGAAVVAVSDGEIVRVGRAPRLGRYVQLRDAYGNTYTYARLKKVVGAHARAEQHAGLSRRSPRSHSPESPARDSSEMPAKVRLFAHSARRDSAGDNHTQWRLRRGPTRTAGVPLRPGVRVVAGTVLGRVGKTQHHGSTYMLFEIRPAGRGTPRIDPTPILEGWRLLQSTEGRNALMEASAADSSIRRLLAMEKHEIGTRVLSDPRIQIYECGRRDIQTGRIDRRVLATLEFLAASGLDPTVSALECGHSLMTSSGNISEHSTGSAVDIAAINGIPIAGHQGAHSITETTVRRLLTLQGAMKPHQIISLMQFAGASNTFAMSDHADHIHIGWRPSSGSPALQVGSALTPKQWARLMEHLRDIKNPAVR